MVLTADFPREDYEVSLEARRLEGTDFFCGLTFPVGKEPCTLIIGGWGGTTVGLSNVDDYSAALTKAGVKHRFHRYDGAGHAFQNFPSPERYRKEQSEDAWEKVLAFMGERLR